MRKGRVKPVVIGAFVVGAFAIAAAVLVMFGSGRLFAQRYKHVAYFGGSVSGLDIGAPVTFRGVDVGEVTGVNAQLDAGTADVSIEVIFEIDPERLSAKNTPTSESTYFEMIDELIKAGFRAQIETKSFVTGRSYINLVFKPDTPIVLQGNGEYHEFPTTATTIEQIRAAIGNVMENIAELPIEDILYKLQEALDGIAEFVDSEELRDAVASVSASMDSLAAATGRIDAHVDSVAAKFNVTADSLQLTMREIRQAVAGLERVTSEESPIHYELTKALDELSEAARAMRLLAEYLERHPEALLVGKEQREEK
jgi:paraquat-inducible protein B